MSDELIRNLGLDPESIDWQDLALCQHITTSLFYEDYESDPEIAKATDQACLTCPVMKECATIAQENNEYGVWGAIYWNGSGKPDVTKNSHKTEVTWEIIRGRIS